MWSGGCATARRPCASGATSWRAPPRPFKEGSLARMVDKLPNPTPPSLFPAAHHQHTAINMLASSHCTKTYLSSLSHCICYFTVMQSVQVFNAKPRILSLSTTCWRPFSHQQKLLLLQHFLAGEPRLHPKFDTFCWHKSFLLHCSLSLCLCRQVTHCASGGRDAAAHSGGGGTL